MENKVDKLLVGETIEVKITDITNYGAFCEYDNGYRGLIHISNIINSGFVKDIEDYFKIGEIVKVEILDVNHETKKLGLSTKKFKLKNKYLRERVKYEKKR